MTFVGGIISNVVSGLIVLFVEYWIVPLVKKTSEKPSSAESDRIATRIPPKNISEPNRNESRETYTATPYPPHITPYLFVVIGFTGAFAGALSMGLPILGLVSALDSPPPADYLAFCGLPLLVIAVIGGAFFSLLADAGFDMQRFSIWWRLPLAVIIGALGGWAGILLVGGIMIYLDERKRSKTGVGSDNSKL